MGSNSIRIKDVASLAQVSVGTVSNVLNRPESVAESTRIRVLASIETLGFVRNESARHLRAGQSRTIGFVAMDSTNPFFTDIGRSAESVAREAGSFLLMASSYESSERELDYLGLFEQLRAQGILISPSGDVTEALLRLRARGIPTVLVDSPAPSLRFSSVQTDDVAGGRLAVQHLLSIGCRRVGFVGGPSELHQMSDRLAGAYMALRLPGHEAVSLRIWNAASSSVDAGRSVGSELIALPADQRPDGLFVTSDVLAIGIMSVVTEAEGITIPRDMAIIGYDDIAWAQSISVPLSSIRQPRELIGASAARLLLDEADKPDGFTHQQLLFKPELVVRASTRRN